MLSTSTIRVSTTGGIAECTALALPGDVILVDQPYIRIPHGSISLSAPGVKYDIRSTIDFGGNGDNGLVVSAPGVELHGIKGVGAIIACTDASGILLDPSAEDCLIEGVTLSDCNVKNNSGAGAIFAMSGGPGALIRGLRVWNCQVYSVNGHSLNIGGVLGGEFKDCLFESTFGLSAEGMSVIGSDLHFLRCTVNKAATTGILVWGAKDYPLHNITFEKCTIKNSSQAVLPPPLGTNQKGNNSAMQICVNDGCVCGVKIVDCTAYDDQLTAAGVPSPTQDHFLDINGTTGTLVQCVFDGSNRAWGNVNPQLYTSELPAAQMIDCQL